MCVWHLQPTRLSVSLPALPAHSGSAAMACPAVVVAQQAGRCAQGLSAAAKLAAVPAPQQFSRESWDEAVWVLQLCAGSAKRTHG